MPLGYDPAPMRRMRVLLLALPSHRTGGGYSPALSLLAACTTTARASLVPVTVPPVEAPVSYTHLTLPTNREV